MLLKEPSCLNMEQDNRFLTQTELIDQFYCRIAPYKLASKKFSRLCLNIIVSNRLYRPISQDSGQCLQSKIQPFNCYWKFFCYDRNTDWVLQQFSSVPELNWIEWNGFDTWTELATVSFDRISAFSSNAVQTKVSKTVLVSRECLAKHVRSSEKSSLYFIVPLTKFLHAILIHGSSYYRIVLQIEQQCRSNTCSTQ